MAVHRTVQGVVTLQAHPVAPLAQIPRQRCPQLGQLSCQRHDDHTRGHVYHGAWAPDRHDAQE
jgi:hypothetical protein